MFRRLKGEGFDSQPKSVDMTKVGKNMAEMGKEIAQEVAHKVRDSVERARERAERRRRRRGNTVMTRLSDEDLKHIDILVGVGLFESRSEAVAYLTHEGIVAKEGVFQQLTEKLDKIKSIRDEARALIGSLQDPEKLSECPSCGEDVSSTAKFCPNCGKQLT